MMKKLLTTTLAVLLAGSLAAQGVKKLETLSDDTRILSTTWVTFAKKSMPLSKSPRLGMRHITVAGNESFYVIVVPMTSDHYLTLPAGQRLVLSQANGQTLVLHNLRNIERMENENRLDAVYTIYPEYLVTEQQLEQILQSEVVSVRQEQPEPGLFASFEKSAYAKDWSFNRMLLRCYNVLRWRLAENSSL